MKFLNDAVADSTTATVTGFLNAISTGCSNNALSLAVSGGYNNTKGELGINVVVEINGSLNV